MSTRRRPIAFRPQLDALECRTLPSASMLSGDAALLGPLVDKSSAVLARPVDHASVKDQLSAQRARFISVNRGAFQEGRRGRFVVRAVGVPAPRLRVIGRLPRGLTFTAPRPGTAILAGTPAAGTARTYRLYFTALAGRRLTTQQFTLTIRRASPGTVQTTITPPPVTVTPTTPAAAAPAFTSTNTTNFTVARLGSFLVTASGTPVPSLSVRGSLAAGVTFTDNGNGSATIAGTPQAGTSGVSSFQIVAQNGIGSEAVQDFTLAIGNPRIFVAAVKDAGPPRVNVFDAPTQELQRGFLAFAEAFAGGVSVAAGDVSGDGIPDIIAGAAANGGSQVKVFDGATFETLSDFFAFPGFNGGISVASGDVNGDGRADIVVAASASGHVKAFDGTNQNLLASFLTFQGFNGGVSVAAGDVNGDGKADLIVGAAANGHVKAFDGTNQNLLASFFAFQGFTGGVSVAGADVNGDGRAELVVSTTSTAPHVKVFDGDGLSQRASFLAFPGFNGGVNVGALDLNGDGNSDLVVGVASSGPPQLRVFDGVTQAVLADFIAFPDSLTASIFVAGA